VPRRLLPDDEAITAAIRAAGGVTTAAAEALGVSPHRLSSYLSAHPRVWPEGVERRRDSAVSDDDVTNALRAAQGRIADAARALGVPRHMVTARLRRHPGVWPSDTPRPRATDAEVAAALASSPSVAAAARLLGVSRQALHARLRDRHAQGED